MPPQLIPAAVSVQGLFFLQVHFVPEAGTVAQIVYSEEQERPSQQVVYTADGTSYTSVDTSEHTLVYIHPVEATQARVVLSPPLPYGI